MASAAEPVAAPGSRPAEPPPAEPPPVEPPPVEFVPDGPDEPPAYATEGPPPEAEEDAPAAMPQSFRAMRSEEHTSELQSLMRISYAVFCLKKKKKRDQKKQQMKI